MDPRVEKPARIARVSRGDILLFVEACAWMTLAGVLRAVIPFRWCALLFGKLQKNEIPAPEGERDEVAAGIARAIARGGRRLPFARRCLVQALAAKAMLRIRRRKSVVFIGVGKSAKNGFAAHVWVRCGKLCVCGAKEMRGCKVIAVYSD